MAKNWAIVIGINEYDSLTPLKYAKTDAEAMKNWLEEEAKFDRIFLFTEDSPNITTRKSSIPTKPTFGCLRRFLRAQFEDTKMPPLSAGDNLWFFFAGHGCRYGDQDYLMLEDSDPGDVEYTAISVNYVTQRLGRSGADNVVLFLDACRDDGNRGGLGIGMESHKGVITFYSCNANQKSWEIDELQHGSFTYALLEGLRIQGERNCATVERLDGYLIRRIPEINIQYNKIIQNPYLKAEPPYKMYFILLKQYATIRDAESLKLQAFRAESEENFELAKQLWIRVLIVSPADIDAIAAIERIVLKNNPKAPQDKREAPIPSDKSGSRAEVISPQSISPPPPTSKTIPLESEVGVDYTRLRDLLAKQKWKEADQETLQVMLKATKRVIEGWLRVHDMDNFPCQDLRTIDRLWVYYSNSRFGFSVQKKIYQELGGTRKYNKQIWENFGDQVGWRVDGKWIYYKDTNFSLNYDDTNFSLNVQVGHLPYWNVVCEVIGMLDDEMLWKEEVELWIPSLASRLVKCNI